VAAAAQHGPGTALGREFSLFSFNRSQAEMVIKIAHSGCLDAKGSPSFAAKIVSGEQS
jgi:hypothetical protein